MGTAAVLVPSTLTTVIAVIAAPRLMTRWPVRLRAGSNNSSIMSSQAGTTRENKPSNKLDPKRGPQQANRRNAADANEEGRIRREGSKQASKQAMAAHLSTRFAGTSPQPSGRSTVSAPSALIAVT